MLPLRFKYEPVFDIDKDLNLIRKALTDKKPSRVDPKIVVFPTCRAYVVTEKAVPVAIFDRLGAAFGSLLKLALTVAPEHIDNPQGYRDVEVMNVLRKAVHSRGFKRPYTVAVFVGDQLSFHFAISLDLLLVLNERLADLDIVSRDFWEFIFEAGME